MHQPSSFRVAEGEEARVQGLPGKGGDLLRQLRRKAVDLGAERASVIGIAQKRVADMRHVDPDLVRASGFQPAFDKRGDLLSRIPGAVPFQNREVSDCMARIGASGGHHGTKRPVARGTAKGNIDGAGCAMGSPPNKRDIGAFEVAVSSVIRESCGEQAVGMVALGHHHHAARVAIEPMHDSRPAHPANPRKAFAAMVDEGVHQRGCPIARSGVNHQAGRLVDYDQGVVLVEDLKRNVLALRFRRFRLGQDDPVGLVHRNLSLGFAHHPAIKRYRAFADEGLYAAAGEFRCECRRKPLVESLACGSFICPQLFPSRAGFAIRTTHFRFLSRLEEPMAGPDASLEPDEEKPLDPATERVRRKLVRFMVINLGILLAAVMAVVLALVYKSVSEKPAEREISAVPTVPSGEMISGTIPLPAGARIISHSAAGDRLTLLVALADESQAIYLYDIPARQIIGRFSVTGEGH